MNCTWKCAVPGAFLPGLQVPKAHPWKNPGMHFCGICTEWLKCRQYHPKLRNKTAWVLDLQAETNAVNYSLGSWRKNSLLSVHRVELLGRGSTLEPWHSREGALAPPASLWGALNASSSQTEVFGKPRPTWLMFSLGFSCPNCHFPAPLPSLS